MFCVRSILLWTLCFHISLNWVQNLSLFYTWLLLWCFQPLPSLTPVPLMTLLSLQGNFALMRLICPAVRLTHYTKEPEGWFFKVTIYIIYIYLKKKIHFYVDNRVNHWCFSLSVCLPEHSSNKFRKALYLYTSVFILFTPHTPLPPQKKNQYKGVGEWWL